MERQLKIVEWFNENFAPWSLELVFIGRSTGRITDQYGRTAIVSCTEEGEIKFNPKHIAELQVPPFKSIL